MKYFIIILVLLVNSAVLAQEIDSLFNTSLENILNTKISTASKYEQSIGEAPASISIITSDEIRRYGYRTLADVLMNERGFYTTYDRNYVYVGIRGFEIPSSYGNKILVLIDGHTNNDKVYGAGYFGYDLGLALDVVERIEIVRGPGSALYGTGAVFCVINIITKKGKNIDGLNLSVEMGNYETYAANLIYGNDFGEDLDLRVSAKIGDSKGQDLFYKEFNDSANNHGIAEGLDWERYYNVMGKLEYKDLSISGYYSSRDKGVPTAPWETNFNASNSKSTDDRSYVEIKYHNTIRNNFNFHIRGYYDWYTFKGEYPYNEGQQTDRNIGKTIGSELQFIWDIYSNNRLTLGGEYIENIQSDYKLWYYNSILFYKDDPYGIASFYLQDTWQMLSNLSLTFGLRHDYYTNFGNSTNPRLAIIYNPFDFLTFKLLYSEAFSIPNIYEVYYNEPGIQISNQSLVPEKIRTVELVYEHKITKNIFWTGSIFRTEMENLIDVITLPEDSVLQYRNINQLRDIGAEAGLSARFNNGIWAFANYSYNQLINKQTNQRYLNSPMNLFKAGISIPIVQHLTMATTLYYETNRITILPDENGNILSEPFFLVNLNLLFNPNGSDNGLNNNFLNHFNVSLLINNLFDVKYYYPAGAEHKQRLIEQNGRNFLFRISFYY